jgi:hypothetical protein
MSRTPHAIFVCFRASAETSRILTALLRRRGYLELLPGIMWRRRSRQVNREWPAIAATIRHRLRQTPLVLVRFTGVSPRSGVAWLVQRETRTGGRSR